MRDRHLASRSGRGGRGVKLARRKVRDERLSTRDIESLEVPGVDSKLGRNETAQFFAVHGLLPFLLVPLCCPAPLASATADCCGYWRCQYFLLDGGGWVRWVEFIADFDASNPATSALRFTFHHSGVLGTIPIWHQRRRRAWDQADLPPADVAAPRGGMASWTVRGDCKDLLPLHVRSPWGPAWTAAMGTAGSTAGRLGVRRCLTSSLHCPFSFLPRSLAALVRHSRPPSQAPGP